MTPAEKQAVAEEIQRIEASLDRPIETDDIIKAAKKKSSPLHGLFQWDKDKAAWEHWRHQARRILREVRVNIETTEHQVRVPMYVRSPDHDSGYVNTMTLRDDKEASRRALLAEVDRAASALNRSREVADALGLAHEVDALIEQICFVREKAAA